MYECVYMYVCMYVRVSVWPALRGNELGKTSVTGRQPLSGRPVLD